MLAAALIPLIFIFALLLLFVFGAWPVGVFTGVVISALLIGLAVGLVRLLDHLKESSTLAAK